MTVHLHIDHLVLDGLGPLDADAVGAAAQAELARLFTASGARSAFSRDAALRRIDGGAFPLAPGADAEAVGQRVARQVAAGLAGPRPRSL